MMLSFSLIPSRVQMIVDLIHQARQSKEVECCWLVQSSTTDRPAAASSSFVYKKSTPCQLESIQVHPPHGSVGVGVNGLTNDAMPVSET